MDAVKQPRHRSAWVCVYSDQGLHFCIFYIDINGPTAWLLRLIWVITVLIGQDKENIQKIIFEPNQKQLDGRVVVLPFRIMRSLVRNLLENSAHDCTALHCTEPFIIILSSSRYDLNVEMDVKHQTVIICAKPYFVNTHWNYWLFCV